MYAASRLRRRGSQADYWPGFVDLMSTLLLVMIFLLVVYMLAQYFLQRTLSEEAEKKDDLAIQLDDSKKELAEEKQTNTALSLDIAQLADQLQTSLSVRDQLIAELSMVTGERGHVPTAPQGDDGRGADRDGGCRAGVASGRGRRGDDQGHALRHRAPAP